MNSSKKIGVAIAGLGFGNKVHLPAIKASKDFILKAAWHPDKDKADSFAQLNNVKSYTHWERVLSDDEIDALVIATPPAPRFQLALEAINKGKHLLLEKPVALNSIEISKLQKAAIKNKVIVGVDFEYRAVPHFMQAKRLLEKNDIGEIWFIKFDWLMSSRSNKSREWNWYSDDNQGGGVIGALGTHAIDILHWLCGPTKTVSSLTSTSIKDRPYLPNGNYKSVTSEDVCIANLEVNLNDTNIPAQIALSAVSINGRGCWIEIYGSKGKLLLGSDNQKDYVHGFGLWISKENSKPISINPDQDLIFNKTWEDGRIAPVLRIYNYWSESISLNSPMIPGLYEAYNSQLVCDKLKKKQFSIK